MESSNQTDAYISSPLCTNRLNFGKRAFLSRSSEYDNQSHNFKNLNFCDVTLVFSFDSVSSVAASRKVSPNWSLQTMTCHSSHCFSIVWG